MDHSFETKAFSADGRLEGADAVTRQGNALLLKGVKLPQGLVRPWSWASERADEGIEALKQGQLVAGSPNLLGVVGWATRGWSRAPASGKGYQVL